MTEPKMRTLADLRYAEYPVPAQTRTYYREALAGAIRLAEDDLDGLRGGLGALLKLAAKEGMHILRENVREEAND